MKKTDWTRLGALALALVLLVGLVPFRADAAETCASGQHTPGSTLYPANWNNVTGGYEYDYYICTVCGWGVDANGLEHQFVGPCNAGHTAGTELHNANYSPCFGGIQTPFYDCIGCGCPVDAAGNELQFVQGTGVHTPGTELHEANYNPCFGGFQQDYYFCTFCGCVVDAGGNELPYTNGTGVHTPGTELHEADYNPCFGGFQQDFYICTLCGCPTDENGNDPVYTNGTGVHTPGTELHEADYTPCFGGFQQDFYICTACGCPVTADGQDPQYAEGNGEHHLVQVPGLAPTEDEDGYTSFWECSYCGAAFHDEAGTLPIEDIEEILLPKLEKQRVEISDGLAEVPQSVADQYASVDAVYQALVSAAIASDAGLNGEDVKSVLLDVVLQIQNSDGTWTAVTPENFPADGVEVLLPYPDGTNPDDYTFVVTHMITSGSRAGEIEVLPGTLEEGGIRVRFTSLSPVVITSQVKKAGQSTTDKPADGNTTQKPAATTSPATGDSGRILLWAALLLVSGLALVCLPRKKSAQ